jgi:hypothetical protein
MFRILKTTLLTAALGLATLAGASAAEGTRFHAGPAGVHAVTPISDGYRHSGRAERRDRRDHARHGWRHRGCSAEQALDKARWMGVRRARIVDIDRRSIDVVGRRHGERIVMTFARAPRCPMVL